MIVAVAGGRGAPGTTTWALLLAAAWPHELGAERVVVEADADGGVLGARYDLGVEPGVVSFVSALRHSGADLAVAEHARAVAAGVWVLPGPEQAEPATAVWSSAAADVAGLLADDGAVWIADCGRVGVHQPQAELVRHAAAVVLVSGCRREDLVQLPGRVDTLAALAGGAPLGVVFTGRLDYRRDEIAGFAGAPVLAVTPHDDDAIAVAASALTGGRGRRSGLWRAALDVAAEVAAQAAAHAAPADAPGRTVPVTDAGVR